MSLGLAHAARGEGPDERPPQYPHFPGPTRGPRGPDPHKKISPIRAPFPYFLSGSRPENTVIPFFSVPVENTGNPRPVYQNTAYFPLAKRPLMPLGQPWFLPRVSIHQTRKKAAGTRI
jgi:hypothetical protein